MSTQSDKDYAYPSDPVAVEEAAPKGANYDAVFGEYHEGQVNYKSVGW